VLVTSHFRRRSLIGAAAALCAVTALAGCGSSNDSAGGSGGGGTTVTMAVSPYVGLAPLYLGVKQGFFKKEGIDLKLTSIPSSPAVLQTVIGNRQDIGFAVTPSVITAVAKGAQAKCIAPLSGNVSTVPADFSTGIVVKKDSPIRSPKDLAGKKVAVAAIAGQQAIQTQAIVDKYGGDWKSVKLVPLAFGNMNTALKSGNVDAIATTSPFLQQALGQGARVLNWMEQELSPNASMVCSVANDRFIQAHPDLVTKYQKAIAESLDYAKAHIPDARAQLPKIAGITAADAAKAPLGVVYDSKLNIDSIKSTQDMMVKYGYIPAPLSLSKFLDYPGAA
jgi:NitT/TauT family transport system substrate-binding protein